MIWCAHVVAYLACHKLGYHYKSRNQLGLRYTFLFFFFFLAAISSTKLANKCVTVTHRCPLMNTKASTRLLDVSQCCKWKERWSFLPGTRSDAAVKVLKDDQACQNCHQRKGTRADKYIVDLICPVTKRHNICTCAFSGCEDWAWCRTFQRPHGDYCSNHSLSQSKSLGRCPNLQVHRDSCHVKLALGCTTTSCSLDKTFNGQGVHLHLWVESTAKRWDGCSNPLYIQH